MELRLLSSISSHFWGSSKYSLPGVDKLTRMAMSTLPQFPAIDDDNGDVAGAILNYPAFSHTTSSLPPSHHTANESQTSIDFRNVLGF